MMPDSLQSMQRLMRYNDYTRDPLSSQLPFCQYVLVWCVPDHTSLAFKVPGLD